LMVRICGGSRVSDMAENATHAGNLRLVGGRLCLNFANTADRGGENGSREYLVSYADLVVWSLHAGILTGRQAQRLLQEGGRHPGAASSAHGRAVALREALYRIFSDIAAGRAPEASDSALLNGALGEAAGQGRLVRTTDGFAWEWGGGDDCFDRMLVPVAWSAADLLISDLLPRVKTCPGKDCGWLFLDISHNRSRRWCTMETCGNRAKARQHYRKHRATQAGREERARG
jgi:predicted RNA-binding Zn ribbon-like protein